MAITIRYLYGFFFVLSFLFFMGQSSATESGEEGGALRLHSVKTRFTQEKHLEILVHPIISTGTMTFQAPDSLRWEYVSPVHSVLLMHKGKVKKFVERDGVMQEDRGMRLDSMQVILSEITNWLDGRFDDNPIFRVAFEEDKKVVLTPKEKGFADLISRIELVLTDRAGLLERVTIFEGTSSFTRLTFTDAVLNETIPELVFTRQ